VRSVMASSSLGPGERWEGEVSVVMAMVLVLSLVLLRNAGDGPRK
jgi:hypothetical protein